MPVYNDAKIKGLINEDLPFPGFQSEKAHIDCRCTAE